MDELRCNAAGRAPGKFVLDPELADLADLMSSHRDDVFDDALVFAAAFVIPDVRRHGRAAEHDLSRCLCIETRLQARELRLRLRDLRHARARKQRSTDRQPCRNAASHSAGHAKTGSQKRSTAAWYGQGDAGHRRQYRQRLLDDLTHRGRPPRRLPTRHAEP